MGDMPTHIYSFLTKNGERVFSGDERLALTSAASYVREDISIVEIAQLESELTKLRNALDVAEGGLVQLLKCPDAQSKQWAEEALTTIKQAKEQ